MAIHQFTSKGRISGYDGHLDFNRLMRGWTLDQLRLGAEPLPAPGFGPPWQLVAKGKALHRAKRLDLAFLERVAAQAKESGVVTIRGTPREPK